MKVLFSYDIFCAQNAGGVSRCMLEVMRALDASCYDWSIWAPETPNIMLQHALLQPWMQKRAKLAGVSSIGRLRGTLRNELAFARWVSKVKPRVIHRSYYPVCDLADRKIKHVETLHDLWDERLALSGNRAAKLRSLVKRQACLRADVVVCVSEHTKADAIAHWPELESRLVVIHHGVAPISYSPQMGTVARPFFLFVGRRDGYKNFPVVASALASPLFQDHLLVCFGGGSFTAAEFDMLHRLGVTDRVTQLAGSDDLLAGLYHDATALLYPSSFEGFGMPILEAMIHGCPVIASPLTSLPEVGGSAAFYADPQFVDSWIDSMKLLAFDSQVAASMRQRGFDRSAMFSWKRSGERHVEVYDSLS